MKIHLFHIYPLGLIRIFYQLWAGLKLCRKYGVPLRRYVPLCINPMTSVYNADRILADQPRPRTIIDVGANESQMARLLSLIAEPGARVLSFEPIPALNPIGQRFTQALADTDGTADFFIPGKNDAELGSLYSDVVSRPGQEGRTIQVQTARFDTLVSKGVVSWPELQRPILLKLDTEGSELKVLKGFGTFLRDVDYVLTEVENDDARGRHYDLMELCRRLEEAGFNRSRLTHACFCGTTVPSYFDLLFWRAPEQNPPT
ncbi:MAG: FkbM family methyltransferase [Kiritimatiellae bacterium]|nr:FkbM family methyltransferase [Verrucomicrobiota bacterium]MBU4291519.1 FkbM family methyltransferase [Verrucomicrobiota bacterium]MCG2678648.1 FkbM family methyltransferase [Kiritimatiellia bacterium]